jgi:hypothetical protein
MESHSHRSESCGHTSNTLPKLRYPHPSVPSTTSLPSCLETAASKGPCDSPDLFALQDSDHRSIRVCDGLRHAVERQEEDRKKCESGKILPVCDDEDIFQENDVSERMLEKLYERVVRMEGWTK